MGWVKKTRPPLARNGRGWERKTHRLEFGRDVFSMMKGWGVGRGHPLASYVAKNKNVAN